MRAEIRAGELLREMEKNKGSRGTGSNQHQVRSSKESAPPKLSDLGVFHTQSSRWQKLARCQVWYWQPGESGRMMARWSAGCIQR
jgi:hypothetical protein